MAPIGYRAVAGPTLGELLGSDAMKLVRAARY